MKKRTISIILTMCMVIALLPVTALAEGIDIESMVQSYTHRYACTGDPIVFDIDWRGGANLAEGTDYTISYTDEDGNALGGAPIEIGDYKVIVRGIGSYSGNHEYDINIYSLFDLTNAIIYFWPVYPYTGSSVVLDIEAVKIDDVTLTQDTDYTISYTDEDGNALSGAPIEIGEYYAVFTGKDSYSGEKREPFSIRAANNLMFAEVSMDWFYAYTGTPVVITGLAVTLVGKTLIRDTDYEIKYFDENRVEISSPPIAVGRYQLSFIGKDDYVGEYGGFLLILEPNNLMLAEVSMTGTYEYTGLPVVINDLVVTLGGNTLIKDVDYTVSYEDEDGDVIDAPTEVGEYYVIIEGKGAYTEDTYLPFTITENTTPVTKWTDKVKNKPDGYNDADPNNITISTAEGLAWLASVMNGLNDQTADSLSGKTVTLAADIDLSGYNWTPMKDFFGTFEGGGHSISNMTVTNTDCAGLFGFLKGTVQNLSVSGSVSSGGSDDNYAGGIAGFNTNDGKIINCNYQGASNATGGTRAYAGGLVGLNKGAVKNCYNTGTVTASDSTNNHAGGLVGYNDGDGTVTNCYNTGDVTANGGNFGYAGGLAGFNTNDGTVTNCYNAGDVTANGGNYSYAGGLLGRSNGGTMTNCYWLNTAASAATGSGGSGSNVTNCASFTDAQGKGAEATFAYTIGANPEQIGTLSDALNAWVGAQTPSNDYFGWTNLSGVDYPVLYPLGISYTVTFESNGGTAVSVPSFPYGATITEPDVPTRAGYTFVGWYKDEGLVSAWDFQTGVVTSNMTLYAKWTAVSSPTRPNDNSGGGITATTPLLTPEQPNPTTIGSINPSATVDGAGGVSATVTEQDVKNAINAALALAKREGVTENGIGVAIDFSALQTQFNSLSLTLGKEAFQALVDAGVKFLEIKTPQISLSLDLQTLKTILQNMGDEITISAEKIDPTTLTGAARTALGSRPAYRLSIADGEKKITNFGGRVSGSLPYVPANSENPIGLYAVYVDGAGGVQWLWNSSYNRNAGALLFRTGHFSTFGIGYKEVPSFTDIANHWAKSDIEHAAVRGLMNGTSASAFSPERSMTRGMFITALGRLADVDSTKYKSIKFADVKADAYYAPYVAWAAEKGITSGTSATTFSPDKLISRQEMAVLLANYAKAMGYTLPKTREAIVFADAASIGSFAINANLKLSH